jgi:hypothetical protein
VSRSNEDGAASITNSTAEHDPEAIISRLRLDSVTFISELFRSHGDIVELPLGKQSLCLLNNPAYDPSRWTPEESAGLPEYAYFPFSQGARACAGGMFAKLNDAIILATLGEHWRPRLVPGQHFRPITYKSNAPRPGIEMSMERRRPGATSVATSAGHAWPRIHS